MGGRRARGTGVVATRGGRAGRAPRAGRFRRRRPRPRVSAAFSLGAGPRMKGFVASLIQGFDVFILVYFLALNGLYMAFSLVALVVLVRHRRRWTPQALDTVLRSPATPPISVIVPAFCE